ncbi:hypothetical protein [Antrihabitans cavernicola]|uniref:Uncharacterized protein n=1 Tax=Antrihabitans cavernicola TaxID=2495913 RepID=A0A5A7SBE2_9NOCA|nr:hypothetical protein [Spelaeibacter cavernicola]KAA0022472.1 hypothetical protein FOY51_12235 [Spelaeibacter cavernicola]
MAGSTTHYGESQWQHLAAEARSGRLFLDPSVARDCLAACDDLLLGLEDIENLGTMVQRVDGMGGFDSGHELAAMFGKKGAGGTDSIDQILRQHKDVVCLMRDTIAASVQAMTSLDFANAQSLSAKSV